MRASKLREAVLTQIVGANAHGHKPLKGGLADFATKRKQHGKGNEQVEERN
jgi:hypothetical protein